MADFRCVNCGHECDVDDLEIRGACPECGGTAFNVIADVNVLDELKEGHGVEFVDK